MVLCFRNNITFNLFRLKLMSHLQHPRTNPLKKRGGGGGGAGESNGLILRLLVSFDINVARSVKDEVLSYSLKRHSVHHLWKMTFFFSGIQCAENMKADILYCSVMDNLAIPHNHPCHSVFRAVLQSVLNLLMIIMDLSSHETKCCLSLVCSCLLWNVIYLHS